MNEEVSTQIQEDLKDDSNGADSNQVEQPQPPIQDLEDFRKIKLWI